MRRKRDTSDKGRRKCEDTESMRNRVSKGVDTISERKMENNASAGRRGKKVADGNWKSLSLENFNRQQFPRGGLQRKSCQKSVKGVRGESTIIDRGGKTKGQGIKPELRKYRTKF